jgi:protoporphyrin/coproporphyrin ferrochelatase
MPASSSPWCGYLDLLARSVGAEVAGLGVEPTEVVFTAHSLPTRILDMGDPYPEQLAETAAAVAARAGVERWSVGWQSAGRTPEPWIGPDILAVLPALKEAGAAGVVVCAAGFVSDHLEVLYDLDVEARAAAAGIGLAFTRTPSPNADPAFCATVADVIRSHA